MSTRSHYLIDLPSTSFSSDTRLEGVLPGSAKRLRLHVERFARYFLREMRFGGIQFEAAETPDTAGYVPFKAFLLAAEGRYIGAGCFRNRIEECETIPWVFDWLWLHPFCRRRGHLSYVWPALLAEMGHFRCAKPLSVSMERFLAKMGYGE